ncbi:methyltransferase domain-containing protein [Streptomyces sp. NPDC050095]|uniref:methyltransferase domain-containing protein n=1 Tax=unclassified Streptomyces TaxID=2593676 RepID=UPI00342E0F7B
MNWPDTDTAVKLRREFAARTVPDPASPWRVPFERVPRHVFVPCFYRQDTAGIWNAVNWGDRGYLDAVYSDAALTTQIDEQNIPTSSSSQPTLMLAMLEALDPQPGQSVLELGTGTGYNLALLADRLGDHQLVSMEPDEMLAAAAIRHLQHAGHQPMVIAGDGTLGYPRCAPYDRIISTVGLTHIPPALLAQGISGTQIVAPLGYGIVNLTLADAGHATGRFLPIPAQFMATRGPAVHPPAFDAARDAPLEKAKVAPERILDSLKFPLSLALPGHTTCSWNDADGRRLAVGIWTPDGSTAIAHVDGSVRQVGPGRVWDTVEAVAADLPETITREDFHVTITAGGQVVVYGEPGGPQWHLPVPAR